MDDPLQSIELVKDEDVEALDDSTSFDSYYYFSGYSHIVSYS